MSWARVDDGWWCHPKVLGLSAAARGVWISALSWSCGQRTDFVPEGLIPMLGGSNCEANELASCGLWVASDGGWRFHDWAEYQQKTVAEKRSDAGRKGGVASGEARRQTKQTEAKPKQEPKQVSRPVPSRPVPSLPEETDSVLSTSRSLAIVEVREKPLLAVGFDAWWDEYPRKVAKTKAQAAWTKARRNGTTDTQMLEGLRAWLPYWQTKDPDFIPHPTTWLNETRWNDRPPAARPRVSKSMQNLQRLVAEGIV